MSGRRDSNPLPTAWEAVALPGELLPLIIIKLITFIKRMKYLKLYIVLLGIVASFYFFNKKIGESSIHKMVQSNFRIEVKHCGCFGCGSEVITTYKNNGKRWLKVNSDSEKNAVYELTPEKEIQLEILLNGIINKSISGGCTTWSEYAFENTGFRFKIFDHGCLLSGFFRNSHTLI